MQRFDLHCTTLEIIFVRVPIHSYDGFRDMGRGFDLDSRAVLAFALYLATTSLLCTIAACCACLIVPKGDIGQVTTTMVCSLPPDTRMTFGMTFCPPKLVRKVTAAHAIL